eukprot:9161068-Pyramimonas_sp.AAC.1
MIRILALRGFDQLEVPKGLTFDAYSDDLGINAIGTTRHIMRELPRAAKSLEEIIENVLFAQVSPDKVGSVASSKEIARHAQKRLGGAWRSFH